MKLKSIIACTAVLAAAIATDHGATAAGSYTITGASAGCRELVLQLQGGASQSVNLRFK